MKRHHKYHHKKFHKTKGFGFTMPKVGSVSDALGKDGFHVTGIGTPTMPKRGFRGMSSLLEHKRQKVRSALDSAGA